jgi:hypothetical protein
VQVALPRRRREEVASSRADSLVAELLGRDDELAQLYDLIDGESSLTFPLLWTDHG